jgi:hypothetical protein
MDTVRVSNSPPRNIAHVSVLVANIESTVKFLTSLWSLGP